MLIEYGLIPEEPGMEEVYTIIPEDLKFRPTCPCLTRTCPNHGFCKYCKEHHAKLDRKAAAAGRPPHGPYCSHHKN